MLYGLYISGLASIAYSTKFDVISNNIANLNTVGFRPSQISFQERLTEALERPGSTKYYNSMVHRYGGAPYISEIISEKKQGPIEATGRMLDVAINGDGYFGVRNFQTNKVYYTRAGNFITNSQGQLITQDGKYGVLNADGDILTIDPEGSKQVIISDQGNVTQGNAEIGKLSIATGNFVKYQDNMFEVIGTTDPVTDYKVVQGSLETSAANPVFEMTEMLKTLRVIETNLNMIRMQDGTLDRLINDVGRPAR